MLSTKRIKIKTIIPSLPSLSAETIANNDDLLTEILLRLPIKSLLKFKCVSKHWLSLISNPLFSNRLYPSNYPSALFVHKWSNEFDFINLDSNNSVAPFRTLNFVNDTAGIRIIKSCNGLLLCSSFRSSKLKASYYIYNPTTKQYTILPPLTKIGKIYGLYLAFDPWKSPHFKVICVRQRDISQPVYQIEIYSSKIGPWRVSGSSFTLNVRFYGGVFWNGAIHWYTDSGPSYCFDVVGEQVKEFPMPPIPNYWYRRRVRYFRDCRGHLYVVDIYNAPSTQFNVCEMERDYSGWSIKYRVDLDGIVRACPEMINTYLDPTALNYYAFQIICIVRGESEDDSYLVLHIPSKIIRYDLKDKSFKKICDFSPAEDASNMRYYDAYEYIESLACI